MSEEKVECEKCKKLFSKSRILYHFSRCFSEKDLTCNFCKTTLTTKRNFEKHLQTCKKALLVKETQSHQNTKEEYENKIAEIHKTYTQEYEKKISEQEQRHCEELNKMKNEYLKKTTGLELEISQLKISFQQERKDWKEKESTYKEKEALYKSFVEYKKTVASNTSNSNNNNVVNSNNIINNIMLNIDPIIEDELTNVIKDSLSGMNHDLPQTEDQFAYLLFKDYLRTRLLKSDVSRDVLRFKLDDVQKIDTKAQTITSIVYKLGKDLAETKMNQLQRIIDKGGVSTQSELTESLRLCERVTNETGFSKCKFSTKITKLALDKSSLSYEQNLPKQLDPYAKLILQMFQTNAFLPFCLSINNFGSKLKEFFSDLWCLPNFNDDPNVILIKLSKNDEYKPWEKASFRQCISSLLTEDLRQKCINDFNRYDEPIFDENNAKVCRTDVIENIQNNFDKLLNPDSNAWDLVYNILLCID